MFVRSVQPAWLCVNQGGSRGKLNGVGSYGHLLVAESAGTLHGAIAFHFITPFHDAGQWCVISALVIDEATRGAGIGRQLLLETERYALEAGCSRIELACNEKGLTPTISTKKMGSVKSENAL